VSQRFGAPTFASLRRGRKTAERPDCRPGSTRLDLTDWALHNCRSSLWDDANGIDQTGTRSADLTIEKNHPASSERASALRAASSYTSGTKIRRKRAESASGNRPLTVRVRPDIRETKQVSLPAQKPGANQS